VWADFRAWESELDRNAIRSNNTGSLFVQFRDQDRVASNDANCKVTGGVDALPVGESGASAFMHIADVGSVVGKSVCIAGG
jgi:hypothetical protein